MINFTKWFDAKNTNHVKAFAFWCKEGVWPNFFLPSNVKFFKGWELTITQKIVSAK